MLDENEPTDIETPLNYKENEGPIDRKQIPQSTGLEITLGKPQIILKDRPYLKGQFSLDCGEIKISNNVEKV